MDKAWKFAFGISTLVDCLGSCQLDLFLFFLRRARGFRAVPGYIFLLMSLWKSKSTFGTMISGWQLRTGDGFPWFCGKADRRNAITNKALIDERPSRPCLPFTPQCKDEAVAVCLVEGLTCTAVAHCLGIPVSSLA